MNKDISRFDLSDGQLEQIQKKYELIEPLLDEYLSLDEKRRHAHMAREQLQISERTLRRYVQHLREEGPRRLARKKRSDSGKMRVFHPRILKRAEELLEQNPSRSIPMLMRLLQADAEVAELVKGISSSTLYHYLKKAGHRLRGARGGSTSGGRTYRRFAAEYPNHLWQGDARHGIALPHPSKPGKKKMTYLFAWVDDFSRKILEARYYWDEKLPRMQDCFRRAVLRWGLPDRLYCDNGRVYISKHFLLLVSDLKIKKIHHPAYAAWCKGKIENVMKLYKSFQGEAQIAGIQTIEELNATLAAWTEVEYNNKIHSGTGETPNERWRNNLTTHPPRRITDLEAFNALFLWRTERTIDKFATIRFQLNSYRINALAVGTTVGLRYNPFDLAEVHIYHEGRFHCVLKASTLSRTTVPEVPEEKKSSSYSPEAADYFKRIREKANEMMRLKAEQIRYSDLGQGEDS
ncbi:MAG: DDE-type integrase/transposase/recombinase [Pirellulales bacterium]|jgi:transposase InsO family protein|nr:DDE-type integrase/transposase/recombinase [Pirellulales bacterium]|tara:strand:- start:1181 stop:2566 length:1386 start_codon:yes stop_codon:yes gene_type:complete